MPTVHLDDSLEMYFEDDDYTDPWRLPETERLYSLAVCTSPYKFAGVIER